MNRLNIAVLLVILQLAPLFSQGISNPQVIYVLVDPSGPCGYGYITVNRLTGNTKGCVNGTWTNISGSIGPTGPTGPTGPNGFPVPTAQAVTSGVTTSVVIPFNGTLTDKSQASPVCVTSAGVYTLAWTSVTNTTTQMTVDFSGTTTAGFTGTCTAIPSIGPVGPTGPTGAAGAGSGYCAPSSASATTYTCAPSPAFTSYAAGMTVTFVPDVTSGANPTVNVNGLGAKNIKLADGSTSPASGRLAAGASQVMVYDGTSFRLPNAVNNSTTGLFSTGSSASLPAYGFGNANATSVGFTWDPTGSNRGAAYIAAGSTIVGFGSAGLQLQNTGALYFSGNSDGLGGPDTSVCKDASGVVSFNSGSCGTYREIKYRHSLSNGTAPTIASGFGTSPSIAGFDESGRVTVGSGGSATTGVISFGSAYGTAPSCVANDETTLLLVQATATTTQLTLTSATAWTAADKITWRCGGY